MTERRLPAPWTTTAATGLASSHSRAWTWVAAGEVVVAAAAVVADWFIPAVVLVAMAAVSLMIRRRGPGSLGFHRTAHAWRLTVQMLLFAAVWSLFNIAALIPVTNHLSGQRQDMGAFADLQGNPTLLVVYLVAAWLLAAFTEETAFRGYLLTRLRDVLGDGRLPVLFAVVLSSLLFGLLHTEQGLVGVTVSALAGVVYALLRYRCRTLWAPVLAHGFVDTIGFVWFYLFGPMYGLW